MKLVQIIGIAQLHWGHDARLIGCRESRPASAIRIFFEFFGAKWIPVASIDRVSQQIQLRLIELGEFTVFIAVKEL